MSSTNSWWETPSPELAYLFGFAFADGNTKRSDKTGRQVCSLILAQADRAILDRLVEVAPGGRISHVNKDGFTLWRAYFGAGDGLTVYTLKQWGIVPNKTEYGHWPKCLTEEMLPHYIRGFFDGDGWLTGHTRPGRSSEGWTVGFVCHLREYLVELQAGLKSLGVDGGILVKDGRNYRLRYSRHGQIARFLDVIYQDATIAMQRKLDAGQQFRAYYAGRHTRRAGENHHNSILTAEHVREMRALRKQGRSLKSLSELFGTEMSNVSAICRRKAWQHID